MIFHLLLKNLRRNLIRNVLAVGGIAIALIAFTFIRTIISAWYGGVEASAKDRLITRNAISLVFPLPLAYEGKISSVKGVKAVGHGNWFGGVYKDERGVFPQFAVSDSYLDVYPEYIVTPEEKQDFLRDRKGALVGEDLAKKYGWNKGDVVQLKGTIYPGLWEFTISGIFKERDQKGNSKVLLFHWEYLNEKSKETGSTRTDTVGFYAIQLSSGEDPAQIARLVDEKFANSYAETLTETETAFQQSFVSMSTTIIQALNAVSGVIVVIILLVLSNALYMTTRERLKELTILKSIGFRPRHFGILIVGEGMLLGMFGYVLFLLILVPLFQIISRFILSDLAGFFPQFSLDPLLLIEGLVLAIGCGMLAGVFPFLSVKNLQVAQGLRLIE